MRRRCHPFLLAVLPGVGLITPIFADELFENEQLRLHVTSRSPQQIAAFYEARGFPKAMIERLRQVCFLTLGIRNKSAGIIWHDMKDWHFSVNGQPVQRFDRDYWKQQWQQMDIPMASQSTFRWTLLPEQLDFRPQETEGGNITLPRMPGAYDIQARFRTGDDGQGPPIEATLRYLRCAEDRP